MSRKMLLTALLALVACALVPASAPAQINVAVGIGDQSENLFDDSNFKRLRVKKVRYFIKWDAIDRPGELAQADAYVNRARANGADVLMHFSSNNLTRKAARLPSVSTWRRKVKQLIDRYRPQGVRTFGSQNEANHDSQPTWNNPRRAAQFFLALRSMCRGCRIVGLDVLDQRGVDRYINRFFRALGSRKRLVSVVGVHNYSDTNRFRDSGTRLILRTVKRHNRRAKFWLTETGAVVKFGSSFRCSQSNPGPAERRAARAIDFMFRLTRRFRRDLQRLYIYNFFGDACAGRFDAGIVKSNSDPSPRPAYERVRRQMRNFRR
jgi:hypothetical protein